MPTLEEVEAAFREWRTTKRKKWDRIPEELLTMARGLVGEHTAGTISFRLGITADKLQVAKEFVATEEKFVEISGPEIGQPQSPVTVRFRPGTKNEIVITIPASSANWPELIKGLSRL